MGRRQRGRRSRSWINFLIVGARAGEGATVGYTFLGVGVKEF